MNAIPTIQTITCHTETIYATHLRRRGELRKGLIRCLRGAMTAGATQLRAKDRRGRLPDMVSTTSARLG